VDTFTAASGGDPDLDHTGENTLSRSLRAPNTVVTMSRFWCLAVVVLIMLMGHRAPAQAIPVLRLPIRISTFATFTDAKPSFGYYGDRAVWGFTTGGIVQLPRFAGLEVRGSMLRYGGISHQESALAGPRVAVHIFHTTPYASFLLGEGNASWWSNPSGKGEPKPRRIEAYGFQWTIASGLDIYLHSHITLRLGELSYSHLYEPNKTLVPLTASTGLVFRIR
jgi:hypothetical protein